MTKNELINKLYNLPKLIEEAENKVIASNEMVLHAKALVLSIEDRLLLEGAIDGKNAEARAAQMREKTFTERRNIQPCENQLSIDRACLNRLNNELAVCKAIAGILKGVE